MLWLRRGTNIIIIIFKLYVSSAGEGERRAVKWANVHNLQINLMTFHPKCNVFSQFTVNTHLPVRTDHHDSQK
jgi:hypothetical protein